MSLIRILEQFLEKVEIEVQRKGSVVMCFSDTAEKEDTLKKKYLQ